MLNTENRNELKEGIKFQQLWSEVSELQAKLKFIKVDYANNTNTKTDNKKSVTQMKKL